jgi:hypothetical protein
MVKSTNAAFLLQAAALISGAAARCLRTCPADDPLLNLLYSEEDSSDFCRGFLGFEVSTVEVSVTPTVWATATETAYVTEVVTEVDSTITVTVPAGGGGSSPTTPVVKRDDAYPTWLPTSFGSKYVSKACSCLNLTSSVTTVTATAEEVVTATYSDSVTVTEIETTTLHTTAVATETAAPPSPATLQRKIQVLRKSTGAFVGWLYDSNGVAVAEDNNFGDRNAKSRALNFQFTLPAGATAASQLRLTSSPGALGFKKDSHPSNIVQLEDG